MLLSDGKLNLVLLLSIPALSGEMSKNEFPNFVSLFLKNDFQSLKSGKTLASFVHYLLSNLPGGFLKYIDTRSPSSSLKYLVETSGLS